MRKGVKTDNINIINALINKIKKLYDPAAANEYVENVKKLSIESRWYESSGIGISGTDVGSSAGSFLSSFLGS